ncbi:MAG: histidinol dehydrogenase [Coriobacteriia bacterium]|nr:histidinol dehydrogenase [Coriobacteriia bacterium]MCL2749908.1 histidinol dehydrogenase [Coriobacteriia bacterium]
MRVVTLEQGQEPGKSIIDRKVLFDPEVVSTVAEIIQTVREQGDRALIEYSRKFDGTIPRTFEVPEKEIQNAANAANQDVVKALQKAGQSILDFHERQKREGMLITRADGALLGTKVTPLDSVGIYVPGGKAFYPSTVLMCALPARVAGVRRIVMVTPPEKNGHINPALLAAAQIAGVTEVYAVGGAQAIAALAYGTESIEPVDKIVGPGNAYVSAAKRAVSGDVGIDMIAGPSELAILADDSSEPALLALDLMAQAEHDPDAACYLITTEAELVEDVLEEIEAFLEDTPRKEITKEALDRNGIIFVAPDLATALGAINALAPEHLEVHTADPQDYLGLIDNAGAIFLGTWSPSAVGDYAAGTNHTLPTSGTARFSSPLCVDDFTKFSNIISYSYSALKQDEETILVLAAAEGLWAHGKSVRARFELFEEEGEE